MTSSIHCTPWGYMTSISPTISARAYARLLAAGDAGTLMVSGVAEKCVLSSRGFASDGFAFRATNFDLGLDYVWLGGMQRFNSVAAQAVGIADD